MPDQAIGGCQYAQGNHKTGEKEPGNAEAAMDVHPAGGDQGRLRHEQKDPARKGRAVQVNDKTG